jgi:bifunctional pyridoxal-dependent enzyme with beta-cystathionase and maltose regulon repressor activities
MEVVKFLFRIPVYCSANHQFTNRLSDDVIVEEIMTQIYADICVMTADGLSSVINYYYCPFFVFFFSMEIMAHVC